MNILPTITRLLTENPILVLFVILLVGHVVGKIRVAGFSLGVVAILFAGLGISAYNPKLALPPLLFTLGLVFFVYTVGIASGPSFFAAFRKKGLRNNLFVVGMLVSGALATLLATNLFHIKKEMAVGMYTGAFTNTPALAAALDTLKHATLVPVVGYSLAYPLGVLCVLAVIAFFQKLWKIDSNNEEPTAANDHEIYARTIRITRKKSCRVDEIAAACGADITVSRISINDAVRLVQPDDILSAGSLITIVGKTTELDKATTCMGKTVKSGLELDGEALRNRRVFISNRKLAGRTLSTLNLQQKLGIMVTRIRRGDVDFVAHPDMMLELGDRVKIVGPYDKVQKAAGFFGDSYRLASEIDILTFAIGITFGILVGLVPIPMPGGSVFHLGAAGGTLLVALYLGHKGRTGKLVWQLPFSTNMALRQIGLVLFLAGIGSQAGGTLSKALSNPASLTVVGVGAALTTFVATITLIVGYKFLHIPFTHLTGVLASVQTQPAVLAFANERAKDDSANSGYANVFPVAMITKIILAQLILIALS